MRLSLLPVPKQAHQQLASGVGWAAAGQLLTSSDDQTLHRWSGGGEPQGTVRRGASAQRPACCLSALTSLTATAAVLPGCGMRWQVCKLDAHVADLHCCPAGARQAGNDVVAAACTDGACQAGVPAGVHVLGALPTRC